MTLMTTFRFHFADELLNATIRFAGGLLFSVPPNPWLPLTVVMTIYQSLQHSDTGFTFGLLDRLFVSSRFHNVHHSLDEREARANFGLIFSVWDFLFGTARLGRRPRAYGISDLEIPESFAAQLLFPFLPRRESRKAVTPLPASPE
jgi:sterol desaturase/sphingolipid hydroxylase (fatty acid hydroxylase superfamily)